MADTIKQTVKSPEDSGQKYSPEVVGIDWNDEAVGGSYGALRVDTEGRVGVDEDREAHTRFLAFLVIKIFLVNYSDT